jgi:hypothetical protein
MRINRQDLQETDKDETRRGNENRQFETFLAVGMALASFPSRVARLRIQTAGKGVNGL